MNSHTEGRQHPDNQIGIRANAQDAHDEGQRIQATVLHGMWNHPGQGELDGEDEDPPELHETRGIMGKDINTFRHIIIIVLTIPLKII